MLVPLSQGKYKMDLDETTVIAYILEKRISYNLCKKLCNDYTTMTLSGRSRVWVASRE